MKKNAQIKNEKECNFENSWFRIATVSNCKKDASVRNDKFDFEDPSTLEISQAFD